MEIYVVRHGKTEFNEKGIIIGHEDSELTLKGISQAEKIGVKLRNVKFDVIIHSELGRAFKTAKLVSLNLNYIPELISSKDLMEVDYGDLAGKLKSEVIARFPKYHKDVHFVNPNGESFREMEKRVLNFINSLSPNYSKILLVTHAGCIRAIYSFFNGDSFQKNINMKISNNIILKCNLNNGKSVNILQN